MIQQGVSLDGRYRLDQRVGGGGMGEVWRADDLVLGRTVAVKVLLPALMDEPGFAERFRNEARIMATIKHPGVVEVYDVGTSPSDGGGRTAYLVMEYVQGESLDTLLKREGALDPERTTRIVGQAAEALHAAHRSGVIHRDVKPANLLVRPDESVVLTDFGIARSATSAGLTDRGVVLGTATYCAPEQAAGEELTPSADIYALGVVAYQCLTGAPPFQGTTPVMIALKHMREPLPPLPDAIPPATRRVVERALAKGPADRWPDAHGMAQAMREALRPGPGGVTTEPFGRSAGRRSRRLLRPWIYRRLAPALAGVAVIGALGAAAALLANSSGDDDPAARMGPPVVVPMASEPADKLPTGERRPKPAPQDDRDHDEAPDPDVPIPTELPTEDPSEPGEDPTDPGEDPTDPGEDPTGTGDPDPDVTIPDCEKQAC